MKVHSRSGLRVNPLLQETLTLHLFIEQWKSIYQMSTMGQCWGYSSEQNRQILCFHRNCSLVEGDS